MMTTHRQLNVEALFHLSLLISLWLHVEEQNRTFINKNTVCLKASRLGYHLRFLLLTLVS